MTSRPSNELTSELDAFRKEWLSEVHSKRPAAPTATASSSGAGPSVPISSVTRSARGTKAPAAPATHAAHGNDDYVQAPAFDELFGEGQGKDPLAAGQSAADGGEKTLESALDHFEAAVMREAQGNLGDSLNLYRKAFRVCKPRHVLLTGKRAPSR